MVTTRPPKTIVKPTALGPVANTDTKLLIYGLFQKGRVLAQDGVDMKSARRLGNIGSERRMRPRAIVVVTPFTQQSTQMLLRQRDKEV